MENKRILVIGGTGYIGKVLSRELMDKGYEVTILTRNKRSINLIKGPNYLITDLLNKDSLIRNIREFDLVINLASVISTFDKRKYKENITGLRNLIEALKKNKIRRLIYFSTQNVHLNHKGHYSESKKEAEKLIKESNIDYLIIRPNYVYGIDKNNYFYKMIHMIKDFHLSIIIGDGNYQLQPILKDDLVEIVIQNIKDFPNKSLVLEISGKETLSFNKVIQIIENTLDVKSLKIHLPLRIITFFKHFIPFDINGFYEDKISKEPFKWNNFSNTFEEDIKKLSNLN